MEQKIRPISPRNQITISQALMQRLGLHPGDLVSFVPTDEGLFIKPVVVVEKEKFLSKQEWKKLDKLIKAQESSGEFVEYSTLKKALGHSHKRMKRK